MSSAPVESLFEQALAHHRAGQLQQAEAIYRRILAQSPQHSNALHHLAILAHQVGNNAVAADLVARAIAIRPDVSEYHNTLGEIQRVQQSLGPAEQSYRRAIELSPETALYHSNLSLALRTQRRLPEAIAAGQKAIELDPQSAPVHLNLANALSDSNQYAKAIVHYRQAVNLDPSNAGILTSLGATLSEMGQFDEALDCFNRAIALNNSPDAHFNRSFVHLLHGDFAQGWEEFEWRWQSSDFPSSRLVTAKPQWDGSNVDGKTVLLFGEQGAGDAVQFIRYAPMVTERSAGNMIVLCRPELKRLFQCVQGALSVSSTDEPLPHFDFHVPLLSLPRIFQTTVQSIPASVPYLSADPALILQWKTRIGDAPGRRVGLVWQGRTTHPNDRNRSVALKTLAPLFKIEGIRWISLQKGPGTEQIAQASEMKLLNFSNEIQDFADTAAVIANLDLVIGVDTAVVHVAGALGKPVWTILPFVPEWRWLRDRKDSPWYPTMRLFRQTDSGNWSPIVDEMTRALRQ